MLLSFWTYHVATFQNNVYLIIRMYVGFKCQHQVSNCVRVRARDVDIFMYANSFGPGSMCLCSARNLS